MKSVIVRSLIAVSFCICVRLTFAGDFHSAVVPTGGLTITIPDQHFIRIRNFTQDGAGSRGLVSVTPTGGSATNVLSSSFVNVASPLEPINSVVIAGPATVSIKAGSTTTFVTYIKQHDSD